MASTGIPVRIRVAAELAGLYGTAHELKGGTDCAVAISARNVCPRLQGAFISKKGAACHGGFVWFAAGQQRMSCSIATGATTKVRKFASDLRVQAGAGTFPDLHGLSCRPNTPSRYMQHD